MQRHAYFQYAIRQYIVESIMKVFIQSQHVIQSQKVIIIINFHKERFTMTIHVMVIITVTLIHCAPQHTTVRA